MIGALHCRNYRSLEDVDIPMSRLTAVVGPNGTGKTSALRALGLPLSEFWPTMRSIRVPQDFTRFDPSLDLSIEVTFDPPLKHIDALGKEHEVPGLSFACRPYKRKTKKADAGDLHADFDPIGPKGEPPMVAVGWKADRSPDFKPLRVTNDLRDQARVLLVDHRRSVLQHLPSTRGSALGKLFSDARKELDSVTEGRTHRERFADAYAVAMDTIRTPHVQEIERTIEETAKRMAGFMGKTALQQVEVGFGFADPADPLNSLRLVYREGGLTIPADELGLGIQSALVVGIFDALRRLGGPVGTLVIEEPEMYLHPQAQRYFYRLLCEMADRDECQVIYSTHSPIFADIARFESIRLFRKEPGGMSSVSLITRQADQRYLSTQRDARKLVAFDATRSEVLFARRALLVEGPADRLAILHTAKRMGHDPDAEDLAVVVCGTKTAIPFFARVCAALEIPFFVLHDEDVYPHPDDEEKRRKLEQQNAAARNLNEEIIKSVGDTSRIFLASPTLEALLGVGRSAGDKPRRVVQALDVLDLSRVPQPVQLAIEALFAEEAN
jgi:putative ATP-dependent endonuclease of the OLD family